MGLVPQPQQFQGPGFWSYTVHSRSKHQFMIYPFHSHCHNWLCCRLLKYCQLSPSPLPCPPPHPLLFWVRRQSKSRGQINNKPTRETKPLCFRTGKEMEQSRNQGPVPREESSHPLQVEAASGSHPHQQQAPRSPPLPPLAPARVSSLLPLPTLPPLQRTARPVAVGPPTWIFCWAWGLANSPALPRWPQCNPSPRAPWIPGGTSPVQLTGQ